MVSPGRRKGAVGEVAEHVGVSLKARYLLCMVGSMPLFYLFVAIRAAVECEPSHLSSSLVSEVLVFGVVNVVGAAFIFRPIDKFLVNPGVSPFRRNGSFGWRLRRGSGSLSSY